MKYSVRNNRRINQEDQFSNINKDILLTPQDHHVKPQPSFKLSGLKDTQMNTHAMNSHNIVKEESPKFRTEMEDGESEEKDGPAAQQADMEEDEEANLSVDGNDDMIPEK